VADYEPLSRAEQVSLLAERDQAVAEGDRVITQLRAEAAARAARLERPLRRGRRRRRSPAARDAPSGRQANAKP